MANKASHTAYMIAEAIASEVANRTGLPVVKSQELLSTDVSDGVTKYPVLLVGDDVATHAGCRIVIKNQQVGSGVDALGNPAEIMVPHEILVGFETVSAGGVEATSSYQKLQILGALLTEGVRVALFESATGDFFDTADFTTANYKGDYQNYKFKSLASR